MATNIFIPASPQHKRLKRIAEGGENTSVSPETIGSLYQGDNLEELSWEYYHMEKKGRRNFERYMEVAEPAPDGEFFVVNKYLTEDGQQALNALEMGWFWNADSHCEAIQETFDFYRDLMKNGKFTVKHADWIVGNNDERFRELRNEVVYFKLKAKRVGDYFVEDKDAA